MGTLRRDVTRAWAGLKKILSAPFKSKAPTPVHEPKPKQADFKLPHSYNDPLAALATSLRGYERVLKTLRVVRQNAIIEYHHQGHRHAAKRRRKQKAYHQTLAVIKLERRGRRT